VTCPVNVRQLHMVRRARTHLECAREARATAPIEKRETILVRGRGKGSIELAGSRARSGLDVAVVR
jgi:hypothetical protein